LFAYFGINFDHGLLCIEKGILNMNERIKYLREKCLSSNSEIFIERALLVTEAYKETTGKPIIIQKALALKKF